MTNPATSSKKYKSEMTDNPVDQCHLYIHVKKHRLYTKSVFFLFIISVGFLFFVCFLLYFLLDSWFVCFVCFFDKL